MTKTQEELKQLKQEYEELTSKLQELSLEELQEVTGGVDFNIPTNKENNTIYNNHIYENLIDPDQFKQK